MHQRRFGIREKERIELSGCDQGLAAARAAFDADHLKAIDIYEQLCEAYPASAVPILAELYDSYLRLPRDRYHLYQARHFDFGILPGDKVLDMGSGHLPFPLATHLCDITLGNDGYGRGGAPFRKVEGKPVFESPMEETPFADKEFDFVYCSHVLEHSSDPERACRELMRIAKRGYIETPTRGKDIFFSSARVSNHTRYIELRDGRLIFNDYSSREIDGLGCDILQAMHCNPQSEREKAFAALVWLKAEVLNTMFLWEGSFDFEVPRCRSRRSFPASARQQAPPATAGEGSQQALEAAPGPAIPAAEEPAPLGFLQVHTFYPAYLDQFYRERPTLARASFAEQMNALVRDGFSAIHIFAPYMEKFGYRPHFVVANNPHSQAMWLHEQRIDYTETGEWLHAVVRLQIETIRPDVLYLSDPITFDARFLSSLSYRPKVVLGWRAANIASGTDWSGFDVMLSSLASLREISLRLGAKSSQHFFPGFPHWLNQSGDGKEPDCDVVFSGSWNLQQYPRRNNYLARLARAASCGAGFSLSLYLNAPPEALPPEVQRFNRGPRFGVAMQEILQSGRIVVDARGVLEYRDPRSGLVTDLARSETANMRIFEATGSGRFLLTEYHENLERFFQPGVEIETFRDEAELLDKIRYYLENPQQREEIARRGQERCLRDYCMERRACELDRIIRLQLAGKGSAAPQEVAPQEVAPQEVAPQPQETASEAQGATQLKRRAEALLEAGELHEAFKLLAGAKGLKAPLQGVDALRARCFLGMGQPLAAVEALREEVRLFPRNGEAAEALARLERQIPEGAYGSCGHEVPEFRELLAAVRPYTMLSEPRLFSLYTLARKVCEENLPGNFVECGVAAGGSSALLAAVVKRHSREPRRLFSFDSFSGMPPPSEFDSHRGMPADATGWGTGTCAAPKGSLLEICGKLGVRELVTPVQGYFEDTLPLMREWVGMIAFLHLDGDWYGSTRTILENLYGQLSNGALLQVDDYGHWDGCRRAIHSFEEERSLAFDITPIDGTGVWIRKPDRFPVNPELPGELIKEFQVDDPVAKGIRSQMSENERFQLYYALRQALPATGRLTRFVEIGSFSGASLFLAHQALKRRGRMFQAICIEPGGTHQFHEIVNLLEENVVHLPMLSHDAALKLAVMFPDHRLADFIFVDGDHSYAGVRQDILDFYPLLVPGGIMMFHDYLPPLDDRNREPILYHHGNSEPGVRQACLEIMEERYCCDLIELPLLYPDDPTQTQSHLPIIPGVFSTVRAYRKPGW